jgi:hypothetical protein
MKRLIFISVLFLMGFNLQPYRRYDQIFPDDFKNALDFLNKNRKKFQIVSSLHNQSAEFLSSIVSPEIMRYSVLSDILETSALEILYCDFGSKVADFSIGRFQMKPSFVESLEKEIKRNKELSIEYGKLLLPETITEKEKRAQRLERLKNTDWEIQYLSVFVAICDRRFQCTKFNSVSEKLVFYATAYNCGFYNSSESIIKKSKLSLYPYGINYKGQQYPYSDVALFFYTRKNQDQK